MTRHLNRPATAAKLEPADGAGPKLLVFPASAWDPSLAERLELFRRIAANFPGLQIVTDHDVTEVERYGMTGVEGLVLLDGEGSVRWRHVARAGAADAVPALLTALAELDASRQARGTEEPAASSRRSFVAGALAASLALAAAPLLGRGQRLLAAAAPGIATDPLAPPASSAVDVLLSVNGHDLPLRIEPRVTLLDALREYAGLTGTKKGCDHGQCGACTVHIDGRRTLSCLTFAVMHEGEKITTIEGLADGDRLHPMQAAFIAHDGLQCGYCTPGQIMSATALLEEPCGDSDADVRECMSGNLCRCGAYPNIVAAVQDVRRQRTSS